MLLSLSRILLSSGHYLNYASRGATGGETDVALTAVAEFENDAGAQKYKGFEAILIFLDSQ
jgi:hypothetical protein